MPTFFGEVADQPSRDVIDAIDAVETGAQDRPTVNVVTSSITRNRTNGPAPWGNSCSKSGTLNASVNPSLPTPAAPATASAGVLSRVGGGCFKELQMNVGTCFHQYRLCSSAESEFRLPTVAFFLVYRARRAPSRDSHPTTVSRKQASSSESLGWNGTPFLALSNALN